MINHVRTLLLNLDGSKPPSRDYPGEEIVPAEYVSVDLPEWLVSLRNIIFGSHPDRAMLNYRLRQLAVYLHSRKVEPHTLALDSRVTYWPLRDEGSLLRAGIDINAYSVPNGANVYLLGGPVLNDKANNTLLHLWHVTRTAADEATVSRLTPPTTTVVNDITFSESISSIVPLHGSSLSVRFSSISEGGSFRVRALASPSKGLAEVLNDVVSYVNPEVEDRLFGSKEPYPALRELWNKPFPAPKLGGLLLAVAQRTEELRSKA